MATGQEEIKPSELDLGAETVPLRGAAQRQAEQERAERLRRVLPGRRRERVTGLLPHRPPPR